VEEVKGVLQELQHPLASEGVPAIQARKLWKRQPQMLPQMQLPKLQLWMLRVRVTMLTVLAVPRGRDCQMVCWSGDWIKPIQTKLS